MSILVAGMCSICYHVALVLMHLYILFLICNLFLSILYKSTLPSGLITGVLRDGTSLCLCPHALDLFRIACTLSSELPVYHMMDRLCVSANTYVENLSRIACTLPSGRG